MAMGRFLVVLLALGSSIAGAAPLKVAVVPGIAVNLDAARVDALSQDLAEALVAELEVEAVGGLEVRRQLPPDGLPPDCVTTPACAAEVARRTGAQQLLFVVMVDSGAGGSIQLDTTWIEPSSGRTASRAAIDLTSTADAEAKAKFQTAAHGLVPDAPVRPKAKTGLSLDTKMTTATPRHVTSLTIVTGAAVVVGLGVGIGFGLDARSEFNACHANPNACLQPARDSIRNVALIADAGFLVAAGAAIATAVLYATSGEAPHVIVSPTVERGVALSAVGRF